MSLNEKCYIITSNSYEITIILYRYLNLHLVIKCRKLYDICLKP